jgi:neutral ceramidase
MLLLLTAGLFAVAGTAQELNWKAGLARAVVTPDKPLWMAGYAGRQAPAERKEQDLFVKVLALEDQNGTKFLMVTMDLIIVSRPMRDSIEKAIGIRHGLPPSALFLNCSHTHSGPEIRIRREDNRSIYPSDPDEMIAYYHWLEAKINSLIDDALKDLSPARVMYGRARAGFAMNRRLPTERGFINSPNPDGPVDHDVPVLRVDGPDRKLRAVVFGYACHNTTLGFQYWNGDYAGYAQEYFEADHPGVTAMFVLGCGADQNPYPRRKLELAKKHGRSLATAIETALIANPTTLKGPLKAAYENVTLTYDTPPTREELQERTKSKDRFAASYATALLDELNANGKLRDSYLCPVQVVRFGDQLTFVALSGEIVVDYSLRLKKELGGKVWVAGYSNDVMAYIPSKRVLLEGGYEAGGAMRYFRTTVHPAYWHESVEERIIGKVHELNQRLGGH